MSTLRFKKRHVTLIEMMIVMFLIALITGVIAYNYRGSLEQGKAFKTRMGMEKIKTILELDAAEHPENLERLSTEWKRVIQSSPLIQNAESLTKDGWGYDYHVEVHNNGIEVRSDKLDDYDRSHPQGMK